MRVMVMIKATANSEAGVLPDTGLLAAMGRFNEQLLEAGVLESGEGLLPSRRGKRAVHRDDGWVVSDGPFPATSELVAGFWIWRVASIDEALEWVRRCPAPMPGEDAVFELRPVAEAEDFGEALTPELRAQEQRLRDQTQR